MVARVYSVKGHNYLGRLLWIEEFCADGVVFVAVQGLGGQTMVATRAECIEITWA